MKQIMARMSEERAASGANFSEDEEKERIRKETEVKLKAEEDARIEVERIHQLKLLEETEKKKKEWDIDDDDADIRYDSDDSLELSDADFKTGEYAKRIQEERKKTDETPPMKINVKEVTDERFSYNILLFFVLLLSFLFIMLLLS